MVREGCARRTRGESGAAAVEFALIALPLVVLLFGIIKYGVYFWSVQGGSDAARQAARASAVGDAPSCLELEERVRRAVEQMSPEGTRITLVRSYTPVDGGAPRATADAVQIGDVLEVRVDFDGYDLPLYAPGIQGGRVQVSAVSRVDYLPAPQASCSMTTGPQP